MVFNKTISEQLCNRSALCAPPTLSQNIKKVLCIFMGQDLMKLSNFYCFIKDIRETGTDVVVVV